MPVKWRKRHDSIALNEHAPRGGLLATDVEAARAVGAVERPVVLDIDLDYFSVSHQAITRRLRSGVPLAAMQEYDRIQVSCASG
jgi:hypothetical protein